MAARFDQGKPIRWTDHRDDKEVLKRRKTSNKQIQTNKQTNKQNL